MKYYVMDHVGTIEITGPENSDVKILTTENNKIVAVVNKLFLRFTTSKMSE